ncbi:fibromodulin a [Latimeria chalumnae]|nr:PREDICTED: fibromodulin [Latimeria chalumnae]|eukprot:XP_006002318.1 PREDICTED: fibromodulin [Latimeria chalumnae]
MKLISLLIITGLSGVSFCQYGKDIFFWLPFLRRRSFSYSSGSDGSPSARDCPSECDCPPNFPTAMYCENRNLKYMPFVPSRMKYVYFQNNQISSIQDGIFDNATGLVWIMLHRNQITTEKVGKGVFSKLKNLERLYLDHNNLTRVPSPLPKTLKELRLTFNQISEVTPNTFEGLENLTTLYLNDNQLTDIGSSFKGLKSLTLLELSNNDLKKLPDSLPDSLHQLYLEYNHVDTIPDEYFRKFPRLQYVRLSNNELTDEGIPSNTFNISTLIELDLSYNKLQKIPSVNPNLENLYLHANEIREFSLGSFCSTIDIMNFSHLRVLRLEGNKIRREEMPAETPLCLRRADIIDI